MKTTPPQEQSANPPGSVDFVSGRACCVGSPFFAFPEAEIHLQGILIENYPLKHSYHLSASRATSLHFHSKKEKRGWNAQVGDGFECFAFRTRFPHANVQFPILQAGSDLTAQWVTGDSAKHFPSNHHPVTATLNICTGIQYYSKNGKNLIREQISLTGEMSLTHSLHQNNTTFPLILCIPGPLMESCLKISPSGTLKFWCWCFALELLSKVVAFQKLMEQRWNQTQRQIIFSERSN